MVGNKNTLPTLHFYLCITMSHKAARLEISGILAENKGNTVTSRINIKQKQTQPTDHTFPVYIIVVEFSKP